MKHIYLLLFSIVFLSAQVFAQESNSNRKGYWWGETPKSEEELKEEAELKARRELPPLPPIDEMMKMHPEEVRELEKKYLDYALWKMTPEATEQYYTVIKVVRLKAKAFAATHGVVKMMNPELTTTYENPQMAAGRAVRKKETERAVKGELNKYKDVYGLIMFSSKNCGYCPSQRVILSEMKNRYNISFDEVDIDENPDLALNFKIRNTPTTLLVKRNSSKWIPISFGLQSLPVIRDHAYRGMLLLEDRIKPEQFYTSPNQIGSNLDPLSTRAK
tara:strand:- start:7180 stop:8001 length:822 start_codon:yes stop_codon:yes gene_type:complete